MRHGEYFYFKKMDLKQLCPDIEKYSSENYEIEYSLRNKLTLFRNIQQYLHVERFERTKIYYFDDNSHGAILSQIRRVENVESGKAIYEQKKVVYRNKLKLDVYPYEIQLKVSKETPMSKKISVELANKVCYRYRLIFSAPDFPFEVDLSMRVFPKNLSEKIPTFSDEDLFNPMYIKSDKFVVVYDLEFEMKGECECDEAFEKLINMLKMAQPSQMKGSDLSEEELIAKTFDFRMTPQVNVLTNRIMDEIDLSKFVYLEKTDGLRTLLVSDGHNLYSYRNKEGLKKLEGEVTKVDSMGKPKVFVVDSEFFDGNYYVFDVYFVDEDVRCLPFEERMSKFTDVNFSEFAIYVKTWKQVDVTKLKELIEYAMTKRENVDGIVLQSKEGYDLKEWLRGNYQYKLKPLELTTTDFLYKWIDDEKCYYLYLIGTFGELVFNLKARPRCLQKAYSMFGIDLKKIPKAKSYMILFDSPLFENMYKCVVNENVLKNIDCCGCPIENLEKEGCLDGLIIETSYYMKVGDEERFYQQTPIRVRWDKVKPNGYRIGLMNACILFSPPTADNHYFHKITNEDVETAFGLGVFKGSDELKCGEVMINAFHTINQNIRDYTFKVLKNYIMSIDDVKYKTAFDLCGGRGSDLKRLYSLGFNNIIAADADAEALTTYSLKAIFYKQWNMEGNALPKLTLNCLKEPLGQDGKELSLILKMKQRYEFKKCNLVVIDYALHYICNSEAEKNLKNVVNIIKAVSNPGALVLINFYDGDKIVKKNGDFKIFKIKINVADNEVRAFMPLPTIEKEGYREEPLMMDKHVEMLERSGLRMLKSYYPLLEHDFVADFKDASEKSEVVEGIAEGMRDYLECIRSCIFEV